MVVCSVSQKKSAATHCAPNPSATREGLVRNEHYVFPPLPFPPVPCAFLPFSTVRGLELARNHLQSYQQQCNSYLASLVTCFSRWQSVMTGAMVSSAKIYVNATGTTRRGKERERCVRPFSLGESNYPIIRHVRESNSNSRSDARWTSYAYQKFPERSQAYKNTCWYVHIIIQTVKRSTHTHDGLETYSRNRCRCPMQK